MRSKTLAITIVVLAIGAAPAVAGQSTQALRAAPKPPSPAAKPAAVWTPAPVSGIKWSSGGGKFAVWIR